MFEEIKEELTTLFKLPIKEITYEEINYKLRSYKGIDYNRKSKLTALILQMEK